MKIKTDVTEPEVSPNLPPVIDRLILPDRIEANTALKLQVITRDADKDKLSIVWEVSEGTVDDDVWTSPNRATEVVISVYVSDGENPAVSQTRNVTVMKTVNSGATYLLRWRSNVIRTRHHPILKLLACGILSPELA